MFNSLMCSVFSDSVARITTAIIILMVVGTIIFFLIKSAGFRVFFGYFFSFVVIVCGIFSGLMINKYYNTKGGIIGQISGFFNPNLVEIESSDKDVTFNFSNVMLTEYNDKFRAEFSTDDVITLSTNEYYAVYVNDTPCELIEYGEDYSSEKISSDYVITEYYYAFYDEYKEYILKDTLSMRLAFYKDSTRLIVETAGGEDAVSLWNSYFQKNDFIVHITTIEDIYMSNYASVNLKVDNNIFQSVKLKKGSVYVLPDIELQNKRFLGWSLDGVNILSDDSFIVATDIDLIAIYENLYVLKYFIKYVQPDISNLDFVLPQYSYSYYALGDKLSDFAPLENPDKSGYEFLGWSLDGETIIDLETTLFDDSMIDVVFMPVYENIEFDIHFYLNGGSVKVDGLTYTEDFVLNTDSDFEILISQNSSDLDAVGFKVVSDVSTEYYLISSDGFSFSYDDLYMRDLPSDVYDPDEPTAIKCKSANLYFYYAPIPESDNISDWSDSELCYKLHSLFLVNELLTDDFYFDSVYSARETMSIPYESIMMSDVSNMTNYEIMSSNIQLFDIDAEITESMTDRQYLEILYNFFLERSENF